MDQPADRPLFKNPAFRGGIALFFYSSILSLLMIWGKELSGPDEPRVAGIAREMVLSGNFAVPHLNGSPFLEFPPLGYWPAALLFKSSGAADDFIAHLPGVLAALGSVFVTVLLGRKLGGARAGLAAGFALQSLVGFLSVNRNCRVDPIFLFCIATSLYGALLCFQSEGRSRTGSAILFLGCSLGFLAKGLAGIGIPAAVSIAYALIRLIRRDFRMWKKFHLGYGILAFLLPIVLWGSAVYWDYGWPPLKEVLRQSWWRYFSSAADHSRPFYYYFHRIFYPLLPWTPAPVLFLWLRYGPPRWKEAGRLGPEALFPLTWIVVVFLILTLSSAKRVLYLGPIYPPAALLFALFWERIRERYRISIKTEAVFLLAYCSLVALVHFAWILPDENKESYRPIFDAVKNLRRSEPVFLIQPSEALRGAAVFYLGEKAAAVQEPGSPPDFLVGLKRAFLISRSAQADGPWQSVKTLRLVKEVPWDGSWVRIYLHEKN